MAKRKGKRESSIVDGLLVRSSPSQIKTFENCNLKWGQDKVFHLPTKQSKGAEFGDKCHGENEHYAITGEDVRGRVPRAGAALLAPYVPRFPFNGGDILVESPLAEPCPACFQKRPEVMDCKACDNTGRAGPWAIVTPGGVAVVGYMDFLVPDPIEPEVVDYKFKKDLAKYGSTETELRRDVQSICYGKYALIKFPTAQRVRFTLHEHQTQGRIYAQPVSVVLTREEIEKEWVAFAALLDGPMRATARLTKPEEFGRDEGKCGAYGGCDFKETCPFSPGNKYAAAILPNAKPPTAAPQNKDRKNMGLLDQIPSDKSSKPSAPNAPANTPTPPAAASLPAGALLAKDARSGQAYNVAGKVGTFQAIAGTSAIFMDSNNAPFICGVGDVITAPTPAAPAGPTAAQAIQGQKYLVNGTPTVFVCFTNGQASFFPLAGGQPILVPTTHAAIPLVDGPSAPAVTEKPASSEKAAVLPPDAPASDPAKATTTPQDADEEEDDGEEEAPTETSAAAGVAATTAPATEPKRRGRPPKNAAAGAATASPSNPSPSSPSGLVLVIDGVAIGGGVDLTGYVSEVAGKMAAAVGAKDVRLADPQGPLGFGKWRAALAEAAKASPPSGLCYVSRGELADAVIEGLLPLASVVIRPVR